MAATFHHRRLAMETPKGDQRREPGNQDNPFPASRWGATGRAHPLSLAQRALWDEQQRDRSSSAYNLLFAARVRSRVSIDRLEHALQTLIDRHPALRTTFHEEGDRPVQHVHSRQDIRLTCVDSRDWDDEQLGQIIRLTARQPLDLADAVMRVALFTRAPDDHVLLLMVHQIAVDAWGLGLLLRELRDLYAGDRLPPAPADTPLDYAEEIAARLEGEEGRALEAFWTRYLAGASADASLPYDRDAGLTPHRAGGSVPFELGVERTARIRQLAREAGTTPYVVLLSAYQLLLGRYTGTDDIVVASPFSGRMRRRWQGVVGNFVNTVVMRARLDGESSFRDLLGRSHQSVAAAMRNRELPFARICELLRAERGGRLDSACRIGFAWQGLPRMDALAGFLKLEGIPAPPAEFGGLALEPYPLPQQEGQLELMLEMGGEVGNSLFGTLRYDSSRFEAETARHFVRHFERLLDQLLEHPDDPCGGASLLDDEARAELTEDWARFEPAAPYTGGVHRMIEEQAALHPDRVAVAAACGSISYRELERRANGIARVLRAGGVDPRTRVAVAIDRSASGAVAALAVLKAGAACLPFDAARPISAGELEAARVGAVLATHRAQLGAVPEGALLRLFALEEMATQLERTSDEPVGLAALPDDMALVAAPSLTAPAEDAAISHRTASALLLSLAQKLGVGPGASVASLRRTNPAATLLDLLLGLIAGATTVIPSEGDSEGGWAGGSPTASIERGEPSVLFASAAIWRALLQSDWSGSEALAAVVEAGSLTTAEVDRLRSRVGGVWAVLEGPSSGAVAAIRRVDRVDRRGARVEALPCVRLCVLDERLQPAALDIPGRVYLGGISASSHPLVAPEGADRLVDPCDGSGRIRLFATERRGRRRAGGVVELLPE